MPLFPDGRPNALLGGSSLLSTGLHAGTDVANASDEEHETRVSRPVIPWVEHDIVRGWQSVCNVLDHFAKDCDCWPLVSRGGHTSNSGITYRMECGYCNRIHCPWQCRVFIHFDQSHAATLYLRKYPNAPAGSTKPLDATFYDRQTMSVVPHELRNATHSNHVCVISTAYVHANHNGFCENGPHCMWEAFCALHPYALHFKRCEIQNWLVDRHINCIHIDPQTGTQTNLLKVMVDKCKRYCERLTRANAIDGSIRHNYEGKLLAVCLKHNFKETARRMGHSLFTSDTPYILPGWSADKDENLEAGGYCILVSTMNLALNHARAQHWSAGNVSMAIDHTYKVILECVLAIQVSSLCVTYTRSVLRWTLMVILTSASTSLLLTKALTGLSTCGGIWSNGRVGSRENGGFPWVCSLHGVSPVTNVQVGVWNGLARQREANHLCPGHCLAALPSRV
jgi:hypothetical protein